MNDTSTHAEALPRGRGKYTLQRRFMPDIVGLIGAIDKIAANPLVIEEEKKGIAGL